MNRWKHGWHLVSVAHIDFRKHRILSHAEDFVADPYGRRHLNPSESSLINYGIETVVRREGYVENRTEFVVLLHDEYVVDSQVGKRSFIKWSSNEFRLNKSANLICKVFPCR